MSEAIATRETRETRDRMFRLQVNLEKLQKAVQEYVEIGRVARSSHGFSRESDR